MCDEEKELVVQNYNLIYKFVHDKNLYMKHGKDEVDDLIGLFGEKLCRMAKEYDPTKKVKFSTYVYRGLTNAYASYIEEKQRKHLGVIDLATCFGASEESDENDFWEVIPDISCDVEGYVEVKMALEEFFGGMKRWERDVILLLADGLKNSEIEDVLGLPRPSIWMAKKKMIDFLKHC